MKTVFNWIFKSKEDLSKKWWHRLFKVLFILGIAIFAIYSIYILVDSYSSITHKWNYVDSFSTRLNEEPYSGEVFSITDLYDKDEVVSEDYPSQMNFGLDDKRTLFPPSAMFLKDYEDKSFCSNQLAIHIEDIANRNDINHYSPLNETFMDLDTNVEIFKDYLRANSRIVNCVMIDSYTIVDREEITTGNGERTRYKFLKPINTSDYIIYRYENNFWGFVLFALSFLAILLLSIIGAMLIYYKVILYIVYGNS